LTPILIAAPFSRFRNMEKMTSILVESVWEDALSEEQILQDSLYLRGLSAGEKRGEDKTIRRFVLRLRQNGYDESHIAQLLGLPLDEVKKHL
jgi:hypothetical protein